MKNKFLVLAFGLIGMSVSANPTNNSEKDTPKNDFISTQEKKCFTEENLWKLNALNQMSLL